MSESREHHRNTCLRTVCTAAASYGHEMMDHEVVLNHLVGRRELIPILDAAEAFAAAMDIEYRYPAPAVLLYISAINVFAPGPDVELRADLRKAKKTMEEAGIWKSDSVQKMYNAAHERANFIRVSEFLRQELVKGMTEAHFSDTTGNRKREDIADLIVATANRARHEAQIDSTKRHIAIQTADGNLSVVTEDGEKELFETGSLRVDGSVVEIFPLEFSETKGLLQPAKIGSVFAILRRMAEFVGDAGAVLTHE